MTTNEPVIGAAVMVKGTTIGVITDIDGRYTISIPADGILSFLCGIEGQRRESEWTHHYQHHYAD